MTSKWLELCSFCFYLSSNMGLCKHVSVQVLTSSSQLLTALTTKYDIRSEIGFHSKTQKMIHEKLIGQSQARIYSYSESWT